MREFGKREFNSRSDAPPRIRHAAGSGVSGTMPTLKLALIGFVAAAAATGAWTMFGLQEHLTLGPLRSVFSSAVPGPVFSGDRMGRASTAPILKACMNSDRFAIASEQGFDPAMLLQMLEAGNMQSRGVRVFGGKPKTGFELQLAQDWGEVADCAFRQDAFRLCDIDNRALAVQAGTSFVRQADRIIAAGGDAAEPADIQALQSVRERVLGGLRQRLRAGVLIAADFNSFVPSSIRDALKETKTIDNACAKQ